MVDRCIPEDVTPSLFSMSPHHDQIDGLLAGGFGNHLIRSPLPDQNIDFDMAGVSKIARAGAQKRLCFRGLVGHEIPRLAVLDHVQHHKSSLGLLRKERRLLQRLVRSG
jgi:hypothetical protein